jgi:hypothetical protein
MLYFLNKKGRRFALLSGCFYSILHEDGVPSCPGTYSEVLFLNKVRHIISKAKIIPKETA